MGATFDGIFRKHMILPDSIRDSAWYSIVDDDWPRVKAMLEEKVGKHARGARSLPRSGAKDPKAPFCGADTMPRGRCSAQRDPEPVSRAYGSVGVGWARRDTSVAEVIPFQPPAQEGGQEPTAREIEVLQLISDGLVNREIGVRLY